ncbi:hypothetical protein [Sandaracinus amylolyticus]|uniref:Outer membrane protein beta-barrel domain-containing protein n=1 Tax=Sandaracinus amylolyticus TaxID=927083 RepID=A0A0F6YKS2_9BACT|nr:hypothetical protein [Sandaracinus amylolyticus]AKF08478.1 hypothetical protein DB32_005627 [Sandaracinus amylolyticus]
MTRIASLSLLTALVLSLAAPRASAQATPAEDAPTATATDETAPGSDTQLSDEQALLEEQTTVERRDDGIDPHEEENRDYFFVGALARALVLPSYPFEVGGVAFPNGYDVPVNGAVGAYFNYRRNGFNIQVEVFYQGMGWNGFLRGENDPIGETEYIESNLGVVYGWFGFSWSIPIADWFAIEIGLGLGVGGVVGDLYRTEAIDAAGSGSNWMPCPGPDGATGDRCETPIEMPGSNGRLDNTRQRGGTYQHITGANPFYFGEGGVPPIFATIDLPRVSFRFKPIRQIQIRVDTAFNGYGFSFGGSVGYGF